MASRDTILSNWSVLIDDFDTSGIEFFERVKHNVRAREVPDVRFKEVLYKDGGFLSDRRTYLRIKRGHVAFDLCASPYGTGYFFSWWVQQLGPRYAFLILLGVLVLMFAVIPAFAIEAVPREDEALALILFGWFAVVVVLGWLVKEGSLGPPEYIIQIPVLGWLYEKLFAPITFYSLDTAAMFQESVRRAVNDAIDETLKAQGKTALSREQKAIQERAVGKLAPVMKP